MGPWPGEHLLSLHRRVVLFFLTNKTILIFLSQNKFFQAWQRQTPLIFNWLTNIFRVKMRRTSKLVIFNIFHAADPFCNPI